MRISLRVRILLLVTGTLAGLAALLTLALATMTTREIEDAVRRDVHTTESFLAQMLSEHGESLKKQSELLAKQPVMQVSIAQNKVDSATIADCMREYLKQMGVARAVATNAEGKLLADTNQQAANGKTPAASMVNEPIIAQVIAESEPHRGIVLQNGKLMQAISVPVKTAQWLKGTFTVYSPIDTRIAIKLRDAIGSEIAFVAKGKVVASSLPMPEHFDIPKQNIAPVAVNQARYFALYAPLPNTQDSEELGYIVLHSHIEATARYQSVRIVGLLIFGVTLIVAILAGSGVSKSITRPLEGVIGAARIVHAGQWPAPLPIGRSDELGLLRSVFNEMTAAMKSSQERLFALIDADPLTGLLNHRKFYEIVSQEAARSRTSETALSLILFDLDNFHQFNQKYGHAAGDLALERFAQVMRETLPEVAQLSRYGGEEFAALLPLSDLEGAETYSNAVRAAFCLAEEAQSHQSKLSVSAGCSEYGTNTSQSEGLILAAELAVTRAKQLGRNRVCRFDSVPGTDAMADPYQLHRFIKDGSLATIQALAAAVDAKDPYTQGHSQRVAQYASELAQKIGLPNSEVELIHTTGTLHDVGKIGIPDAILKKPSWLDSEERTVMETHPVLGEVIVRKVPQLAATLPGVRNHHERWDGKGYPDGLAGEAIPLMARLLALADTFDAMTSDRPYRKGMAWEIALSEIEKNAGIQFDPDLAPPFIQMMRQARPPLQKSA